MVSSVGPSAQVEGRPLSDGELIPPWRMRYSQRRSRAQVTAVKRSARTDGHDRARGQFHWRAVVVGVPSELVTQAIACGDEFVRRTQSEPDSHDRIGLEGRIAGSDDETSAWSAIFGFAAPRCSGFTIVFSEHQRPTLGRARCSGRGPGNLWQQACTTAGRPSRRPIFRGRFSMSFSSSFAGTTCTHRRI